MPFRCELNDAQIEKKNSITSASWGSHSASPVDNCAHISFFHSSVFPNRMCAIMFYFLQDSVAQLLGDDMPVAWVTSLSTQLYFLFCASFKWPNEVGI